MKDAHEQGQGSNVALLGQGTSEGRRPEASVKLKDRTVHAMAMLRSRRGTSMSVAKPRGAYGWDPAEGKCATRES